MLIDTNVWSELTRPKPEARVIAFLAGNRERCLLSTIVLAEMEYGIAKAADPTRRSRLIAFRDRVQTICGDRIVTPDETTAAIWGRLKAQLEKSGETIADMDLLIASQAIGAGVPLVTRNLSDMERTGAAIINPWKP
ncbi:PIN domain-containing protein [Sphingobium abikonense]|uniref:PIN domain-containing protein n=1 Tax=Sphingobium abikonense TaxID=86193 RepID=UPI000786DC41|nr:PIN domain-containing protein [Sphingobium abikonense]